MMPVLRNVIKPRTKTGISFKALTIIHRAGLQVMGGFIVGFDSDTPSIFQRQIDFIQQSGIVTAMVGMLQAPPGTRLFDRLQRENRVVSAFSGDNVDGTTNIIPKMGIDRLLDGYQSIMKQIYSPKNYYRRVRTFLKELKAPDITIPMDVQRILAFFRSCFRLGFGAKNVSTTGICCSGPCSANPGWCHWPSRFAIYGYHYRRICEQYIL